jgi:glycine/D-amino acid oxidase-like deaminating enzyme
MSRPSDFLIIGAGVVGLSIARALALAGKSVTIIDQSDYGTAASGSNLGQLSVSDREPGLEHELVLESLSAYHEAEKNSSLQLLQSGGLFTFDRKEELEHAQTIVDQKRAEGFDIRLLVGDEVRTQEPSLRQVAGAVYSPLEGRINPFRTTSWLYREARKAGAVFLKNCKAEHFILKGNRVCGVAASTGDILSSQLVLATGSWTRELCESLDLDVPVDYIRGTAMVTQSVPRLMNGPVVGGFFTHAVEPGRTIYFGGVQEESGGIIISQANHDGEGYNTDVDYHDLCGMARLFLSHYPVLGSISIVRSWSGVTTVSRTGHPLWGPSSRYEGLFFAVAFKGAFSLAPAVGIESARRLLGKAERKELDAWSPGQVGL